MQVTTAARTDIDRRDRELADRKHVLELVANGEALPVILDEICLLLDRYVEQGISAVLLFDDANLQFSSGAAPNAPPLLLSVLMDLETTPDASKQQRRGVRQSRAGRAAFHMESLARGFGLRLLASAPIQDVESHRERGLIAIFRSGDDPASGDDQASLLGAAELAGRALRRAPLPVRERDAAANTACAPAQWYGLGRPSPDAGVYRRLIELMPAIPYVQHVAGSVETTYLGPRVEQILGWTAEEFPPHPDHWFARVQPADQARVRAAVARAIATREPLDVSYRVQARSGQQIWLRDMADLTEEPTSGSQLWHGVLIDITAEKAVETRLHSMAFYDSLTGLPNRRLVMDRLRSLLSDPDQSGACLLFLDLDRFKFINDGIGHAAGDELLVAVARRLASQVSGLGSLARFGGDEFVVILDGDAARNITAVAEALLDALRSPFHIDGFDLSVDGTIGIATSSQELATPEALLRAADRALYRAKASGRGVYAIYDERIDRRRHDGDVQETALRRALEAGEFGIAYQPVVDIATRQIVAVEALLRWNHPERGTLLPAEFLSLADETGLIVPLGRWVIEEACRQMKAWQHRYPAFHALQVSVNLTGRQIRQPTLAVDIALALRKSGLAPTSLALEVKEADALAASAVTTATVSELNRMGVKVTIDDFGNGWSILDSLTTIAIDDLKLDGSFVSRLGEERQEDVVRALVTMANAVGMDVTAGGVENGEQLALLHSLGCNRAQGRHLAPPLTVDEMEQFLAGTPQTTRHEAPEGSG